jgi:hypothetical protein
VNSVACNSLTSICVFSSQAPLCFLLMTNFLKQQAYLSVFTLILYSLNSLQPSPLHQNATGNNSRFSDFKDTKTSNSFLPVSMLGIPTSHQVYLATSLLIAPSLICPKHINAFHC